MSLDAGRMLERLSSSFLEGVIFELSSDYERSNAAGVGMLLGQLRQQLEGAVALLVEENAALRALFAELGPRVSEASLRERLESLAEHDSTELRVPPLRADNEALRAALIPLHAYAESLGDTGMEQSIWAELAESVRRRERLAAGG